MILLIRRSTSGGELGGATFGKYFSSSLLIGLWVVYLVMSSLEAYGVTKGF